MSDASKLACKALRSLLRDERGGVAIIFAFCCVFLAALVGGAVDFARLYKAQATYRDAMDAAALAGARVKQLGGSDSDAIKAAEAYIAEIRGLNPVDGSIRFEVTQFGTAMTGTGSLSLKTAFLGAIKVDKITFKVTNTAQFSEAPDIEMSLMLDITGSMAGQKIADLKSATEDMIDIVIRDGQGSNKSRIAISPFSSSLKLRTGEFGKATGVNAPGTYVGCVVERVGSEAYTDAGPAAGAYVTPVEQVRFRGDCESMPEAIALSANKSELKRTVASFKATGTTAGHIGTAWAWYMLSPKWGDVFGGDSRPAPYEAMFEKKPNGMPKLRKIAVLMTDGEYNTQYSGTDSTSQARRLCDGMKDTGMEIFTVGFQVGDIASAVETLKRCASAPANFYNVANGDDLRAAFRDIALKASTLRLTH